MTSFIVLIVSVLGISFLCSLLESVILSIQPAYVAIKIKKNKTYGKLLKFQKENIDKSITAILTLNTICNTAGASLIGYKTHVLFGDEFLSVITGLLTLSILFFSEIIPKTLGSKNWKSFAPFAAYAIEVLIILLYPVVWLTALVAKLFGTSNPYKISREEVLVTAELGETGGSIKPKESLIIKNLLMLDNIFVADIMTPQSVVFSLEQSLRVIDVVKTHKPIRYSRIPVFKDSEENIVGKTHRYKIMEEISHGHEEKPLYELLSPIQSVPEKMCVSTVLDFFIKTKEHMALVRNDFGAITGLVTLEDAVETLLGVEIVDETDSVADLRQYALEQWQLRKNAGRS